MSKPAPLKRIFFSRPEVFDALPADGQATWSGLANRQGWIGARAIDSVIRKALSPA